VNFISAVVKKSNQTQVTPARKSGLKAEALQASHTKVNFFKHEPPSTLAQPFEDGVADGIDCIE
jgi:hypothetical protein